MKIQAIELGLGAAMIAVISVPVYLANDYIERTNSPSTSSEILQGVKYNGNSRSNSHPRTSSVGVQQDGVLEPSTRYARLMGYSSWNEWVAHRPKNKMGKYEDDPRQSQSVRGLQPETSSNEATTFPIIPAVLGEETQDDNYSDPLVRSDYLGDYYVPFRDLVGAGHTIETNTITTIRDCPECCTTGTDIGKPPLPTTQVPEPSAIALLLAGLVGIFFSRRKYEI